MVKKNSAFLLIALSAAFIILDQLAKFLAKSYLAGTVPIIKNIFHLTLVMNSGIAFGFLQGANSIVVWLYLIVLGLVLYFYDKFPKGTFNRVMLALIIAGIIGNFIDRIFFGHVIDFIDFRVWPVFNVADIYLNIGVIGMLASEILKKKP